MRVLLTGGSGFIGTRLRAKLAESGHHVSIYDRNPPGDGRARYHQGDVRDVEGLRDATESVDAIFHLAAEHRDNVQPSSLYREVNVLGTRNVVRAAEENDVSNIVFTSTVAVYGLEEESPDEETQPRPFNEYGRSKLKAEQVLREWESGQDRRKLLVVRPTVVFGEGNQGNVATLIRQIQWGRFVMVGTGENRKSMAYVGNLARFLAWSLEEGLPGGTVNYADKPDLTMNELVRFIRRELGTDDRPLVRIPRWLGHLGGRVFDAISAVSKREFPFSSVRVEKFCADTPVETARLDAMDFERVVPIREGLRRMIDSM